MPIIKGTNPKVENAKRIEEARNREDSKTRMLEELGKYSVDVLTLACMYARGYALCGEDVTKTWTNAVRNNQIIEEVYEDALKDVEQKKRRDFYRKVIVDMK